MKWSQLSTPVIRSGPVITVADFVPAMPDTHYPAHLQDAYLHISTSPHLHCHHTLYMSGHGRTRYTNNFMMQRTD